MADAGSSVPEAARAAEMDTGWGCTFHRHFASNAIHRDGYVEDCDQPGSHRVVYVFDPDYLEEHDAALVAAAVAEEQATTGRALESANRRIAELEAEKPPCDEGCQDYPEETCSRHGRKVREVWEMCAALNTRIEAALALADEWDALAARQGDWNDDRRDRADAMGHAADSLRAALASPGEGDCGICGAGGHDGLSADCAPNAASPGEES